jgi:hypothetical protein
MVMISHIESQERKKCTTYAVLLHDSEELLDDLGAWSDHDLTLSCLFGIVDSVEAVVENGCSDHDDGSVTRSLVLKILKSG